MIKNKKFSWFWFRGRIEVPRRSTVKWLVDTGKLTGNVRSVGNGVDYESKVVV